MGFDLATAKPVSSGFDLATAKPADESAKPKTGFQHAGEFVGVLTKHPLSSFAGLAENALSSVTSGVGSLADTVTFADPGAHDWAYQPRTEAGKELASLANEEADKAGEKYDKYAGTGPLAATIKERGQEAMGAVGTVTALAGLRGLGRVGRVPVNVRPRPSSAIPDAVPGKAGVPSAETASAAERGTRLAPVSAEAPSKANLKSAARALYKQAEDAGAGITEDSFSGAQRSLVADLQKQGIDPTLHPDTTAALKRFSEEKGPITLEKLETLRKIAKDAEGAQKPADQRLAGRMVDAIDSFAEGLEQKDFTSGSPEAVQAVKQARDYWKRARKADTLDELTRRAELSAANFSGSGMENALRTEFRALAKNERRMRLFTAEERAAIEKVAKGGPVENSLRMLGKFAPTGVVSAILSGGAGTAIGGPIGAVALPAAGGVARLAAKRMTMGNVGRANALVRRGTPIRPASPAGVPVGGGGNVPPPSGPSSPAPIPTPVSGRSVGLSLDQLRQGLMEDAPKPVRADVEALRRGMLSEEVRQSILEEVERKMRASGTPATRDQIAQAMRPL